MVDERPPNDRLLDAAERRFRRYGYRRATIDDIAIDAGVGKGSVYLHFSSKQDVYLAVVERGVERFVERAASVLSGRGSVPGRLRRLVEVTAEHYGDDELLRASLFGEPDLVDGDAARLAARVQRDRITVMLAVTLREGAARGTVRVDLDPDKTAVVLFEVGWAIVRAHLEGVNDLPLAAALDVLNTIVDHGISTRPEARQSRR